MPGLDGLLAYGARRGFTPAFGQVGDGAGELEHVTENTWDLTARRGARASSNSSPFHALLLQRGYAS